MTKYEYDEYGMDMVLAPWYEKQFPGFTVTGGTLGATEQDGTYMDFVVFRGPYTAWGMVRDCGDHWIRALWSRYDRIDKATMAVTEDVDDR